MKTALRGKVAIVRRDTGSGVTVVTGLVVTDLVVTDPAVIARAVIGKLAIGRAASVTVSDPAVTGAKGVPRVVPTCSARLNSTN